MINQTRIPIVTGRRGYYLRWYYNGWHYWTFMSGSIGYITEGEKYRTTGIRTVDLSSGVVMADQIDAIRSVLNARELYVYTDGGWSECRMNGGNVVVDKNKFNGFELQCQLVIGSRAISPTGFSVGSTKPVSIPTPPITGDTCELAVLTQTWLCANWNAGVDGSRWYGNDVANREIYGGLYTWDQIHADGFCPAGWHVPTFADATLLIASAANIAGTVDETLIGGALKEIGTTHWQTPNTNASDDVGFSARGAGSAYAMLNDLNTVYFSGLKQHANFWIDHTNNGQHPAGYLFRLDYDAGTVGIFPVQSNARFYYSVRLIKD